jgi:hypothetical protein
MEEVFSPKFLDMCVPIFYAFFFLATWCMGPFYSLRFLTAWDEHLPRQHQAVLVVGVSMYYMGCFLGLVMVVSKFLEVVSAIQTVGSGQPPRWFWPPILTAMTTKTSFSWFVQMSAVGVFFLVRLKLSPMHRLDQVLSFTGFFLLRSSVIVGGLVHWCFIWGSCFLGSSVLLAPFWFLQTEPFLPFLLHSASPLCALIMLVCEVIARLDIIARLTVVGPSSRYSYYRCFPAMIFSMVVCTYWTPGITGNLSCSRFMLAFFITDFLFMSLFVPIAATRHEQTECFLFIFTAQVVGVFAASRLKCRQVLGWLDDVPRRMGLTLEEYFSRFFARDEDTQWFPWFWEAAVRQLLGSFAQVDALPASPTRDNVVAQLMSRREAFALSAAHAKETGDCTSLYWVLQQWAPTHRIAIDMLGVVLATVVRGDVTMSDRLQAGVAETCICVRLVVLLSKFLCVSAFTGHKLDQIVAREDFASKVYNERWWWNTTNWGLSEDEYLDLRATVFAGVDEAKRSGEPPGGLPFLHNQLVALVPFVDRCRQEDFDSMTEENQMDSACLDVVLQALKVADRWSREREAWCAASLRAVARARLTP